MGGTKTARCGIERDHSPARTRHFRRPLAFTLVRIGIPRLADGCKPPKDLVLKTI